SRESDKNFIHVQDTDPAMSAAITTAKKTSSAFMEALRHPKPSFHDFNVKKPYPAKPSVNEHMWIADIQEVGDHLEGHIANEPYETTAIKFGQAVSVKLDEISDWKYLDGNRLVGGYTIRYFFERMNDAE